MFCFQFFAVYAYKQRLSTVDADDISSDYYFLSLKQVIDYLCLVCF